MAIHLHVFHTAAVMAVSNHLHSPELNTKGTYTETIDYTELSIATTRSKFTQKPCVIL